MPLDDPSICLLEKQRQFNAAMERYDSVRGYKVFGVAVAVANVSLQAWLLWRVQPLVIGAAGQSAAILVAWVLADFVNGLVHLTMDRNDRYDSLAGPLVANFHLHHKTPRYKPHHLAVVYFVESGSKVWLVPCLAGVALLTAVDGISPLLLHILVYTGILSSVAEVSHYLCHTSASPLAGFLARCGILLSKRHHAAHHLRDNVSYAFLNGITDPLLDAIAARVSRGYKNHTDLHYATYGLEGDGR
ncbi:MAG TPA: fatty acid desaturase CarF family protein [Deferrisomatales bacterium]|nr:fatty acid desaturase CarF family protein [Deferrisomatales bacterium]